MHVVHNGQIQRTDPMPQRMRRITRSMKLRRAAIGVSRVLADDRQTNPASTHFAPYLSARTPPGICEMR